MITGELTRYALSMQCLHGLRAPGGSVCSWQTGVLIAKSLNNAFQAVMDNPALQWAWVMGDDHIFDPLCLIRLLDRNVDVVAPFCLNRLPPFDPTIVDHSKKRMKYLEEMPATGLYQLQKHETCGDAGLLLRRNVLEATGPVWYDSRKSGAIAAEDQAFVRKIHDTGFDVHYDLDNHIGHLANVNVFPVRKGDSWEVRLTGGAESRHVCDLGVIPRADDAYRISGEAAE